MNFFPLVIHILEKPNVNPDLGTFRHKGTIFKIHNSFLLVQELSRTFSIQQKRPFAIVFKAFY